MNLNELEAKRKATILALHDRMHTLALAVLKYGGTPNRPMAHLRLNFKAVEKGGYTLTADYDSRWFDGVVSKGKMTLLVEDATAVLACVIWRVEAVEGGEAEFEVDVDNPNCFISEAAMQQDVPEIADDPFVRHETLSEICNDLVNRYERDTETQRLTAEEAAAKKLADLLANGRRK